MLRFDLTWGVMNSLTVHFIVVALGWDGREVKVFFKEAFSYFFFSPKYKWDLMSLVFEELSSKLIKISPHDNFCPLSNFMKVIHAIV